MAGNLGRLAARLDRIENARGSHRMTFRTPAGRTFSLDITDVLGIMLDCLTWMHTEDTDRPRGRIVEQLATAELTEHGQGLLGHTAILAARQAVQGVRP